MLVGIFLVGAGLSFLRVVGTLLDKDIDTFTCCLVELAVGEKEERGGVAGIFFLVVSDKGLEGKGLGKDPFGTMGLMAIDFATGGLEGFTGAVLEAKCFELLGFDMVVGFTLAGFDTLMSFMFESFDTLVNFELLSFEALVGFEVFDMLVCFKLLGFDTSSRFETVGIGPTVNVVCNSFGVPALA